MKLNAWKKRYTPVGLDIGSTAIRAVQLVREGRRYRVHSALEMALPGTEADGSGLLPADSFVSSTDVSCDRELWQEVLPDFWRRGDFMGRSVVLHCPSDRLDFRPVHLPVGSEQLSRDSLIEALYLQMAEQVAFSSDQAVINYYRTAYTRRPKEMSLMVTTADGQWIRDRVQRIQDYGFYCEAMIPLPEVLMPFCGGDTSGNESDVSGHASSTTLWPILDMGHTASTLVVHDRSGPLFCRRFLWGGKTLADILAQQLMIGVSQADVLMNSHGLNYHSQSLRQEAEGSPSTGVDEDRGVGVIPTVMINRQGEFGRIIYTALEADLNEFAEGLMRSLNYVIYEHQNACLAKMLLAGRTSHIPGLNRFFTESFDWPVDYLTHPLLEDIVDQSPSSRMWHGSWATALGLVLAVEDAGL